MDIWVCLDSSSSMGDVNYNLLKVAINGFLQRLPVSDHAIRVGVRPFR
jgi:hypothetical protein